MNKIVKKVELAPNVKLFNVENKDIAEKAVAGQFVVVRAREQGERIPLTLADIDKEKGTLTLIFQEVGMSTLYLGTLKQGDEILDVIGPLGKPSEIENFGTCVCIGGGIGIAPLYPIIKALKEKGNKVISIIGAKTKELLILENEVKEHSTELYITTDDGSYGKKGFVSEELLRLISARGGSASGGKAGLKIDRVIAIGPPIMMKVVAEVTKPYGIKTIVSLNPIMVDGTGMCGCCRVGLGTETKFACVDGPEFDAHLVDFGLLVKRQRIYLKEEQEAVEKYRKEER